MKSKTFLSGLFAFALLFTISGCASDPYENAGSCETLGESRESEGVVQVCIGIDDNLKWYISGKYFDDFQLLGEIVNELDKDISEAEIRDQGLWEYWLQFKLAVTSEDIANYAEGDTRWDGIIEAIADKKTEIQTQNELIEERNTSFQEWQSGNLSEQKAFEAQQKQIEHMNGPYTEAGRNFDRKIAVLSADIVNKYGIVDKNDAFWFALRVIKSQDTSKD
jgi:TolA-binding protein